MLNNELIICCAPVLHSCLFPKAFSILFLSRCNSVLPPMQLRGNSVKVTKKHGMLREESVSLCM